MSKGRVEWAGESLRLRAFVRRKRRSKTARIETEERVKLVKKKQASQKRMGTVRREGRHSLGRGMDVLRGETVKVRDQSSAQGRMGVRRKGPDS